MAVEIVYSEMPSTHIQVLGDHERLDRAGFLSVDSFDIGYY